MNGFAIEALREILVLRNCDDLIDRARHHTSKELSSLTDQHFDLIAFVDPKHSQELSKWGISFEDIVLGLAASRLLSAIVYQASAQDPLVLAAVAFTAVLTGSLSVAGPVRRVLHADPATLLREQ